MTTLASSAPRSPTGSAEIDNQDQGIARTEPWRKCKLCGQEFFKDSPNYSQKWAGHNRNCPVLMSQLESGAAEEVIAPTGRTRRSNGSKDSIFKCNVCGMTYSSFPGLRYHITTKHPDEADELLASITPENSNRFQIGNLPKRIPKPRRGYYEFNRESDESDSSDQSPKRRKRGGNERWDRTESYPGEVDHIGELVPVTDSAHHNFYAIKQRMGSKLFYIFPVGYQSSRQFKDKRYVCKISREGDRPRFTVVELDADGHPTNEVTATNPSQAAKECIGSNVSGPQFFGLSIPAIHSRILKLPNADTIVAEISDRLQKLDPTTAQRDPELEAERPTGRRRVSLTRIPSTVDEGGFSCPHCSLRYTSALGLRYHIERKHNGPAPSRRAKPVQHKHQDEEQCGICHQNEYTNWISCDSCDRWFHQACAGITPPERTINSFFCNSCRPQSGSQSRAVGELKRRVEALEAENKHLTSENTNVEAELYRCLRRDKEKRAENKELRAELHDARELIARLKAQLGQAPLEPLGEYAEPELAEGSQ